MRAEDVAAARQVERLRSGPRHVRDVKERIRNAVHRVDDVDPLAPCRKLAIQRDADDVAQPRECDEQKGIETQCTY